MNNELEASDMTSALVDAALSEQIPPVTYADVDDRLGEILWDLTYLGKTVSPSTAFRRHLESAISAQLSGNNIPARRAGARHWSFPTFARWWRLPASALAVVTVLLSAAWFSPQARAQLGWLVCYVPGLGIQACDTTGLVMTVPVSVTRGGQTLTVTDLLSSGGQTLVSLDVTVDPKLYDDLQKVAQLGPQVQLSLRDSNGKQYAQLGTHAPFFGANVRSLPSAKSTLSLDKVPFAALDPSVRAVDVEVRGPTAVGNWTVHVPLEPPTSKTVTVGRASGSSATVQGITVTVLGAASDSQYTTVQLGARPGPQFSAVLDLHGALMGPPYYPYPATLRDDKGRVYQQISVGGSSQNTDGQHMEDLYFERVADDAGSAALELPYIIVQQPTDPVSLTVPLTGRHLNDSFQVNQNLNMAGYTFRVTDAYVSEPGSEQPHGSGLVLDLGLDLGGWQNGRRLQSPGGVEVNPKVPAGMQFLLGGPQWGRMGVPLPTNPPSDITLTFKNPRVAVEGPWRLPIPIR